MRHGTQKICLILFGCFLCLFLLEVSLRLAGSVISYAKERNNHEEIKDNTFTILCLGESTTDDQWPPILQTILNNSDLGLSIRVIDEGKRCMNTGVILHNLEDQLDRYKPDMVITMMGINDWGDTVKYTDTLWDSVRLFFMDFRIYKLAKLLWVHMIYKFTGERIAYAEERNLIISAGVDERQYREYLYLAHEYMNAGEYDKALEITQKACELDPQNAEAFLRKGWIQKRREALHEAIEAFKTAHELNPTDLFIMFEYGNSLEECRKLDEAQEIFDKAYALEPENARVLRELGEIYFLRKEFWQALSVLEQIHSNETLKHEVDVFMGRCLFHLSRYERALDCFKSAVESQPNNPDYLVELANAYHSLGQNEESFQILLKVQKIDPDNVRMYRAFGRYYQIMTLNDKHLLVLEEAYKKHPANSRIVSDLVYALILQQKIQRAEEILLEASKASFYSDSELKKEFYFLLGRVYILQKKDTEAEVLFAQAVREFPSDQRLASSFALHYLNQGQTKMAAVYFKKAEKISLKNIPEVTLHNYSRLKEILRACDIQLVAVQYPMRSINILKKMLEPNDDIIFVDNEKVFKDAVRKYGYDIFFWDRFGGDFGHCTRQGNRLLAENIADVLKREHFKKY